MFGYFNIVHISYLMLIVVAGIGFYYLYKDKPQKRQDRLMTVFLIITTSICLTDDFINVPKAGWSALLTELPLFQCDLSNIVLFILVLSKKEHPVWEKYAGYYIFLGSLFPLVVPTGLVGMYFYEYPVWSTFVSHGLYDVTTVLYFKFRHKRVDSRLPIQQWLLLMGMMAVVHGINLLLYYTNAYKQANYFFTMFLPFDIDFAWHWAVLVGYTVIPYDFAFTFMMVGYTAWTIGMYFVLKILETETYKKLKRKVKERLKILFNKIKPPKPEVSNQ